MLPVISGASFAAGLRGEFFNAYQQRYQALTNRIGKHMALGLPSTRNEEPYFYFESSPYFRRWVRGRGMSYKNFKGIQWTVTNYEWARAIPFHYRDVNDDQSKSLMTRARELGIRGAITDEDIFFQIMQGTSDDDLLPAVPNAPDGAALYATTAGGSNRFGISNGNIITGGGVATVSSIQTDYFKAISRMVQFQDTQGGRLLDPEKIRGAKTLYYNPANMEVVEKAFEQSLIHSIVSGTGAAVSNVVKEMSAKHNVVTVPHPKITDNDMYLFIDDPEVKPIFMQEREPLRDAFADFDNSDSTRDTGIQSIRFWFTRGYGVGPAYYTVKINN